MITKEDKWHYITFACPYIDGYGKIEGEASGGYFAADTDEMQKYIKNTPDFPKNYTDMTKWKTASAPFDTQNKTVGWTGSAHGLILHQSFTVNDLDSLMEWDEFVWYGSYDNTIHVYLNGKEIYEDDGNFTKTDWQLDGRWVLNKNQVLNAMQEGENHLVVTLKDAWGDRLFDCGFRAENH